MNTLRKTEYKLIAGALLTVRPEETESVERFLQWQACCDVIRDICQTLDKTGSFDTGKWSNMLAYEFSGGKTK